MLIKGLQKLTLLDFPSKIACTVFLGGCNFRCPFCHNASLVITERLKNEEYISEEEFFSFLKKRQGILEGVCVSGGEPTLQGELIEFLRKIKDMGFLVKLDTNGYRPEVLKAALEAGVVDYVAMDIKSSKEGYARATGLQNIDISKIEESASFLMEKHVPFEFRTTVVSGLVSENDIEKIGEWLAGDEPYFLQPFRDSGDLISNEFGGYDEKTHDTLLKVLKRHIPNAQIRG